MTLKRGRGEEGTVSVITNQFQMKMGAKLNVYTYDIKIHPEVMSDTYLRY